MSKILVTGATGKVGSEVVKQLSASGLAVKVGAHHPDKAQYLAGENVEVVHFDYTDPSSIVAALEGVDKLFFVSATNQSDPLSVDKGVVDAAKEAGVQHIVKLSAAGVENNPTTPLRAIELYIEQSGIPYTHLRSTWFLQNFSTGMADSIRQGLISIPAEDSKTGFIDVRDIAAVAVTAFTNPEQYANKALALTGAQTYDHYQVAAAISKALDKQVKYIPISDQDYRTTATAQYWPSEIIEIMSGLYSMMRQGWTNFTTPVVEQVLGRPPISLEQFAYDYVQVWK